MAIIDKTIQIAKETDDVLILVEELLRTIKNKGAYMDLVDELINAVNGSDKIGDESKHKDAFENTILLRAKAMVKVFTEDSK